VCPCPHFWRCGVRWSNGQPTVAGGGDAEVRTDRTSGLGAQRSHRLTLRLAPPRPSALGAGRDPVSRSPEDAAHQGSIRTRAGRAHGLTDVSAHPVQITTRVPAGAGMSRSVTSSPSTRTRPAVICSEIRPSDSPAAVSRSRTVVGAGSSSVRRHPAAGTDSSGAIGTACPGNAQLTLAI